MPFSPFDFDDDHDRTEVIDAKVKFTSDHTVTITFTDVHVMDVDALFRLLGTDQGRDELLWGIAKGMANRFINANLPIPFQTTDDADA